MTYARNHKDTKGTKAGRINKGLFTARLCALGVFVVCDESAAHLDPAQPGKILVHGASAPVAASTLERGWREVLAPLATPPIHDDFDLFVAGEQPSEASELLRVVA